MGWAGAEVSYNLWWDMTLTVASGIEYKPWGMHSRAECRSGRSPVEKRTKSRYTQVVSLHSLLVPTHASWARGGDKNYFINQQGQCSWNRKDARKNPTRRPHHSRCVVRMYGKGPWGRISVYKETPFSVMVSSLSLSLSLFHRDWPPLYFLP